MARGSSVKAGRAIVGGVAKKTAKKAGGAVKSTARRAGTAAKSTAGRAEAALKDVKGPSPNPVTNLLIADIALRGSGRLMRQVIERTLLGVKYSPSKARDIVKHRSMVQTLLGTAVARIATRSVPGALLVGGGLLAKTLYDRSRREQAAVDGERALEEQAKDA